MRLFLPVIILGCFGTSLSAQVTTGTREAANDYNDCHDRNSSSGSSSSSSDSDSGTDSYWESDYDSDNESIESDSDIRNFVLAVRHRKIMERRPDIPRLVSFETSMRAGMNLNGYFTLLPEMQVNAGLFSFGTRLYQLVEPRKEGRDGFWNLDIDLLQFNFINRKWGRLRIGNGLLVDQLTSRVFHQYIGAMDLFFFKGNVMVSQEARLSTDYCACGPQRKEYNAGLGFSLINKKHIRIYNSWNFLYQQYYSTVNLWSLGTGLRLMIY